MKSLTESRNEAIEIICEHLPTAAERRLFLKLMFAARNPAVLQVIDLEGSPKNAAINIFTYFENNSMASSLLICLRRYFIIK